MGILLNILIFIAALIGILLIVALLIKKEFTVVGEVTTNKPLRAVFDFVKIIDNSRKYNIWWMIDPNQKLTYTGTDGTKGFIAAWDSEVKEAGKGEQEITNIIDCSLIDSEVRFEKPFKNIGQILMTTTAVTDSSTNVKWAFKGNNKFPMTLMNLIIPGMLNKQMNQSLSNLKNLLES